MCNIIDNYYIHSKEITILWIACSKILPNKDAIIREEFDKEFSVQRSLWDKKFQRTRIYICFARRPAPFHHSFLQLSVQFAVPIFSRHLTISPDDSLIDPVTTSSLRFRSRVQSSSSPPHVFSLVPPGRRVSFNQAHISTLISRMVIHRSHQPGLVSARSSSSSASPFCSLPLSRARARSSFSLLFLFRDE